MIANPKNLTEQLLNLSECLGTEMRVLNRTKVSTINGQVPDANGNIDIATGGGGGGGTGDGIPKLGDRGYLAGYEAFTEDMQLVEEITKDSPDSFLLIDLANEGLTVNVPNSDAGITWMKVGLLGTYSPVLKELFGLQEVEVVLGDGWAWAENQAPVFNDGGNPDATSALYAIVFWWFAGMGFAIPVKAGAM